MIAALIASSLTLSYAAGVARVEVIDAGPPGPLAESLYRAQRRSIKTPEGVVKVIPLALKTVMVTEFVGVARQPIELRGPEGVPYRLKVRLKWARFKRLTIDGRDISLPLLPAKGAEEPQALLDISLNGGQHELVISTADYE